VVDLWELAFKSFDNPGGKVVRRIVMPLELDLKDSNRFPYRVCSEAVATAVLLGDREALEVGMIRQEEGLTQLLESLGIRLLIEVTAQCVLHRPV
jgi:hypothetical protein